MNQYTPNDEPNFDVDCQPHRASASKTGEAAWYMPSWARHGVRYLEPHTDLFSLDPEVWVSGFMATVDRIFEDLPQTERAMFEMCERSMQFDIDERRAALDNQTVLVDSGKIRRAFGLRT